MAQGRARAGATVTSTINPSITSASSSTAQARRSESSAVSPQWLPVLSAASVHAAAGAEDGPSTWQCNPQDGSVQRNGVTVDASIPCNWGLTRPNQHAETTTSSCAGAETLAAIEEAEVDRRNLQVVVVDCLMTVTARRTHLMKNLPWHLQRPRSRLRKPRLV